MEHNQLRYQIQASFAKCKTCETPIDCWPDADASEPGNKTIYVSRDALFAGMCSCGAVSEFYLAEVKAGEIVPHDVTERKLGRYVSQQDCTHGARAPFEIKEGEMMLTETGSVEGPAKGMVCGWCCLRFDVMRNG